MTNKPRWQPHNRRSAHYSHTIRPGGVPGPSFPLLSALPIIWTSPVEATRTTSPCELPRDVSILIATEVPSSPEEYDCTKGDVLLYGTSVETSYWKTEVMHQCDSEGDWFKSTNTAVVWIKSLVASPKSCIKSSSSLSFQTLQLPQFFPVDIGIYLN